MICYLDNGTKSNKDGGIAVMTEKLKHVLCSMVDTIEVAYY